MKSILKTINTKLTADITLKTLLGYSVSVHNIRSFESLKKYTYDTILLFGKLAARKLSTELVTAKLREYTLQIQALDKTDNVKVDDILERVLTILHDTTIEEDSEMRSMLCEWTNTVPIFYDNELQYYIGTSYYKLIITDLT